MKHVLLTGATGFLGSHLLEALLTQGYQVTILKRTTSDTWRIQHLLGQVSTFDIDVVPLEEAFKAGNVNTCIHVACSYGRNSEPANRIIETNVVFGVALLECCIKFGVKAFINTDTFFNSKNLSGHLNEYSLSKRQFCEWLSSYSSRMSIINLKLQHVYGPKDGPNKFVSWLIQSIKNEVARIPLTDGSQNRDFIYVKDVVCAYLKVLEVDHQSAAFKEYDVGTGCKVSVKDFASIIYNEMSKSRTINTVLGFGDLQAPDGEIEDVQPDIDDLLKLGWHPAYKQVDGVIELLVQEGIMPND